MGTCWKSPTMMKPYNQWVKPTGTTLRFAPAAYPRRYALKQMPLRQHAFVQDADNFNNTLGG